MQESKEFIKDYSQQFLSKARIKLLDSLWWRRWRIGIEVVTIRNQCQKWWWASLVQLLEQLLSLETLQLTWSRRECRWVTKYHCYILTFTLSWHNYLLTWLKFFLGIGSIQVQKQFRLCGSSVAEGRSNGILQRNSSATWASVSWRGNYIHDLWFFHGPFQQILLRRIKW